MGVLPAAIAAWVAVDMLGPLPLNALLFAGSLVRLSPVVMDFLVQGGEHLLVFASFGGAVLAAWQAAPTRKLWAAETGSPSADQALVVGIVERLLHDPRRSGLAEDIHREFRAGLERPGR